MTDFDANFEAKLKKLPANKSLMKFLESNATKIRQSLGLTPEEKIRPVEFLRQQGITYISAEKGGLTQQDFERLQAMGPKGWSGCVRECPDRGLVATLYPIMTKERKRATLMEEGCHIWYKHPPTQIIELPDGSYARTYNPHVEQEAFWTGAAALVPAESVAKAIWQRKPLQTLADQYEASIELVAFRVKTLSLWSLYKSYS